MTIINFRINGVEDTLFFTMGIVADMWIAEQTELSKKNGDRFEVISIKRMPF
jgi:hypothetical protein